MNINLINSILDSLNNLKLEHVYAVSRFKEASSHFISCEYLFGRKSAKAKEAKFLENLSLKDLERIERQIHKLLDKYESITGTKLDIKC